MNLPVKSTTLQTKPAKFLLSLQLKIIPYDGSYSAAAHCG